jgi:hypothetical protein
MLKNKTALSLSPLALLTLAACGGSNTPSSSSTKGAVQNGPLEGAFAFLDLHVAGTFAGDGVYDAATEQGMATEGASGALGVAGGYSLTEPASGTYTLTATTNAATVDTDTGTAYGAGITLKAPEGASVITPQTTLVEAIVAATGVAVTSAAIEAASTKVATAMGVTLPAGETLATFDPYAAGVTAATKLAMQKANNNVMTVVKSMASAAEGAGVSATEASKLAFAGMYEYVDDNSAAAIDFTLTATMDLIRADVETAFDAFADTAAGVALGLNTAAKKAEFSVVATAAQVEVQEVATEIASLAVGDSDADRAAVFKVISVLADTIETYSKDVSDNGAGSATALAFDTAAQKANTAPTDITLAGSTTTDTTYSATSAESVAFVETASSLVVGALAGVDAETAAGSLTYAIAGGTDAAYFEITGGNNLTFKAQPDYESGKTSYSVAVSVEDALGMKKVETFTVSITDDTTEGGAFQINNNLVTWTDYDPSSATAGTDITSTVMTTTTDSTKTVDMGGPVYLNHTNLTYLFDAESAGTTGKSPTLKFKLSDVPIGVGSATVKVGLLDHQGAAGTESARAAGEGAIEITVKVNYSGDGTTATLTVPVQDDASGSYVQGDGTTGTFTLANVNDDIFSITQDVNVDGTSFNFLDVKMSSLYDAFIAGAGNSDMLKVGSYAVKIESTLPLADAPADSNDSAAEVTTFQGIVELVASTPKDSITGTSGADTITAASTGGMVNGMGGADTITLGSGTDYVILGATLGTQTKAAAATVTNFTDGTDKFALDGLTTSQLTVAEGTTSSDSVISIKATETASGYEEFLMHVTGVATSALSPLGIDYMLVSDIA